MTTEEAVKQVTHYLAIRKEVRSTLLKASRDMIEKDRGRAETLLGPSEVRKVLKFPNDLSDQRLFNVFEILKEDQHD